MLDYHARCAVGGIILWIVFSSVAAADVSEGQPVPKLPSQRLAEKTIRQKYKDEYAKKDAPGYLALSRTLRTAAAELSENPRGDDELPIRFVLLREAREMAVDGGDFRLALICVDDIARNFSVNALEMKMSALSVGFDKADLAPAQLADAYLQVADDFIDVLDPDAAHRTMTLVNDCQQKLHDNLLRQRAAAYDKRITDLRRELRDTVTAAQKLAKDSENPTLNQKVGQYLFTVGRWDEAFPILVKGTDVALRALASREVAKPTDQAAILQLADAWWSMEDSKSPRQAARRRAAYWYRKVLPQVPADNRTELRRKIAESENG